MNNDNQDEVFFCFEWTVKSGWQDLVSNWENIKEVEIEFEEREQNFKVYRKVVSLWTNQEGEIIIINKENSGEIKQFLRSKGINYETYNSATPNFQQLRAKKVEMFADYGEALKDKELEAEKKLLEESDEEAESDEYDE